MYFPKYFIITVFCLLCINFSRGSGSVDVHINLATQAGFSFNVDSDPPMNPTAQIFYLVQEVRKSTGNPIPSEIVKYVRRNPTSQCAGRLNVASSQGRSSVEDTNFVDVKCPLHPGSSYRAWVAFDQGSIAPVPGGPLPLTSSANVFPGGFPLVVEKCACQSLCGVNCCQYGEHCVTDYGIHKCVALDKVKDYQAAKFANFIIGNPCYGQPSYPHPLANMNPTTSNEYEFVVPNSSPNSTETSDPVEPFEVDQASTATTSAVATCSKHLRSCETLPCCGTSLVCVEPKKLGKSRKICKRARPVFVGCEEEIAKQCVRDCAICVPCMGTNSTDPECAKCSHCNMCILYAKCIPAEPITTHAPIEAIPAEAIKLGVIRAKMVTNAVEYVKTASPVTTSTPNTPTPCSSDPVWNLTRIHKRNAFDKTIDVSVSAMSDLPSETNSILIQFIINITSTERYFRVSHIDSNGENIGYLHFSSTFEDLEHLLGYPGPISGEVEWMGLRFRFNKFSFEHGNKSHVMFLLKKTCKPNQKKLLMRAGDN